MNETMRGHESILIVDDEPLNLRLLEKLLNSQGYRNLTLIEDSRLVLDEFQKKRYDLVMLDINMPHKDGYQVMKELIELQLDIMPPMVVLTAQRSRDFLMRALAFGASDFLTKPFDNVELLMRVRNLLDAHLGHRLLHDEKKTLEQLVRTQTEQLRRTQLEVVQRLGRAAEFRDEETGNHILRMSHYCAMLARKAGWDEEECELLLHASPMHDVGKIAIPDAILLKAGRLDPEEWEIMKSHTVVGAQLLSGEDSPLMRMACEIAGSHHEKWDGSGYPKGLAGEEIPISARIAALADVYDALRSERPYKKAWTQEAAIEFIQHQRGRHFDPALVDLFLEAMPEVLEIQARFAEA